MGPEFKPWGKTPRLFRDIVITEKIDGTNACVIVTPLAATASSPAWLAYVDVNGEMFGIAAQSRNRLITQESDNAGFAAYVKANAWALAHALGPGYHFGEWWGSGIQRAYGLTGGDKRFSLFNVHRYGSADLSEVPGLGVVPTVHTGTFTTAAVSRALAQLAQYGSFAAPGFMKPEGVIVYHSASSQVFKALIENDDRAKSAV